MRDPGHRRRRVHRLALRAHAARPTVRLRTPRHRAGQAHLRRQPRPTWTRSRDPRYAFVHGDICDARAARPTWCPATTWWCNFAAESHVDRSIAGAAEFVRTNVLGTQTLLQAALTRACRTVVQVSTDEVYGSIDDGLLDRGRSRCAPNSPVRGGQGGRRPDRAAPTHRTHGLDVRVTRCSNNYGPYQYPEKVIPLFVTNLLDGRRSRCTATAATSATGCTSTTTAGASSWCGARASRARSTTSAAAPS